MIYRKLSMLKNGKDSSSDDYKVGLTKFDGSSPIVLSWPLEKVSVAALHEVSVFEPRTVCDFLFSWHVCSLSMMISFNSQLT